LKVVILSGGLGTRLRPYTLFVPKPMLPLADKPLLQYIIEWLNENGLKDIVISVSYLRKSIEDYFLDGRDLNVKIDYVRLTNPLGTAGQLKEVDSHLDSRFICLYGDSFYNFNLNDAISFHTKKKSLATIVLKKYKTSLKYGFLETDSSGAIKSWREKPEFEGLINIGCYIMEPEFLNYIPKNKMYGMDLAFQNAIDAKEKVFGYVTDGEFIDIGDKESYDEANKFFTGKLGKIL